MLTTCIVGFPHPSGLTGKESLRIRTYESEVTISSFIGGIEFQKARIKTIILIKVQKRGLSEFLHRTYLFPWEKTISYLLLE